MAYLFASFLNMVGWFGNENFLFDPSYGQTEWRGSLGLLRNLKENDLGIQNQGNSEYFRFALK